MIDLDLTEVNRLAADLGRVSGRVVPVVAQIVEVGAHNIKDDWSSRWQGMSHLPALAAAVDYDIKPGLGVISAEIGVNKGKPQGPLGNIAEFGSVKNAPRPAGGPALAAEAPKFAKALGEAAGKVLE